VAILDGALGDIDETSLGDAIEEVWHLLDPTLGSEPGDVLLSSAEVARGTALWQSLRRAPWPADPETLAGHAAWVEVAQAATAFLEEAGSNDR
jgi:hypothetical protein